MHSLQEASLAHDLANKLQVISQYFDLRSSGIVEPSAERRAGLACKEATAILRRWAHGDDALLEFGRVDLSRITREAITQHLNTRMVKVVFSPFDQSSIFILGDEVGLARVAANIVKNAAEAMPDGGELTVSLKTTSTGLLWCFKDSGCGLHEPISAYRTTKPDGTGLGLVSVKQIIERHHGTFEIENNSSVGVTVSIFLPI